ncbi:MAG: TIGR02452 family protein [Bacteroidales bacterium]|nr:TIGR02452 family protein [Bacteroidales bacterium]
MIHLQKDIPLCHPQLLRPLPQPHTQHRRRRRGKLYHRPEPRPLLQQEGFNVAVLNMASRRTPGGGVIDGAGAQEQNLFRRSNLFQSMYQFAPFARQYGVRKSIHQYPLDRNFGGVYTKEATVFRASEREGYALLQQPFQMDFIAVAGINRPALTPEGMIEESLSRTRSAPSSASGWRTATMPSCWGPWAVAPSGTHPSILPPCSTR